MSINVTCDSCGAVLKTKDSMAGRVAKCPQCGERIQIPEAEDQGIFDAEEVLDDAGGFDFGGYDPNAGSGVAKDDRRPCPACGEMIKRGAAKCRYCGEIFDPALKKQARRSKSGVADIDEDMTTGDWVVAVICSGIGCIAGIVWMIQGKPKGPKMFGVSLLFDFLKYFIMMAIQQGQP